MRDENSRSEGAPPDRRSGRPDAAGEPRASRGEYWSAIVGVVLSIGLGALALSCGNNGSGKPLPAAAPSPSPSTVPSTPPAPVTSPAPPQASPAPTPSPPPPNASNWLYVANQGSDNITTFKLDPSSGTPSLPSSPDTALPANYTPTSLAVDPTSAILFVGGTGGSSATAGLLLPIQIANGKLTSGSPIATGSKNTLGVAVDPKALFVYTADLGPTAAPGSVSQFSYAATTGALTALSPAKVAVGTLGGAAALTVDSTGGFLFTGNPVDDTVGAYTIASGALSAVTGQPFPAPASNNPGVVVVHTSGKFLFTGTAAGTILTFAVNAGALVGSPGSIASTSTSGAPAVFGLAQDSTGSFLFCVNQGTNDVTAFTIGSNGALTTNGSPIVVASSTPDGCVLNGANDMLYVVNNGLNSVSFFTVAANGQLATGTGSPISLPTGDTSPVALAVSK
jgi:6-phosphogluconolactonase (cycloisomerase 2 family)